jgi:hypothetical protein
MKFDEILFESKAVERFCQLQGLGTDDLYELFFHCFSSYIEMMKERVKNGRELNRMISAYRNIRAFRDASPERLFSTIFNSPRMHSWFARRFCAEVDNQIINKHTDTDELWLRLSFSSVIPVAKTMEEILNETATCGNKAGSNPQTGRKEGQPAGTAERAFTAN